MRREAEKEKVLTTIHFTESKEVGHLSALKSDEGSTSVIPKTSPGKLAQTRKRARTRIGRKQTKDRCATQIATTHQPNSVEGTHSGDEATKERLLECARRPKHTKTQSQRGCCRVGWRRMSRATFLKNSRMFQNGLEPSGTVSYTHLTLPTKRIV